MGHHKRQIKGQINGKTKRMDAKKSIVSEGAVDIWDVKFVYRIATFFSVQFRFIFLLCLFFERQIDFTIWLELLFTIRCCGLPLSHWDSKTNTNRFMVYSTNSFLTWRLSFTSLRNILQCAKFFFHRLSSRKTDVLHILMEFVLTLFIYLYFEDVYLLDRPFWYVLINKLIQI